MSEALAKNTAELTIEYALQYHRYNVIKHFQTVKVKKSKSCVRHLGVFGISEQQKRWGADTLTQSRGIKHSAMRGLRVGDHVL